jgi:hypothetical protein
MDTEVYWADAIWAQSVVKKGQDFLAAFQYFRSITTKLCKNVVGFIEGFKSRNKFGSRSCHYKQCSAPDPSRENMGKGGATFAPDLTEMLFDSELR